MRKLSELESEPASPGVESEAFKRLANQTLFDNNLERRMRNFGMLLEKMRPEDAVMMHYEFVRMHQEGRPFGEEYALFASRWGEVDGAGVMKLYFEDGNPNPNDVRNALRGWGQKDPQSAMDWIDTNENGSRVADEFGGRGAVLIGWARLDDVAATDWVISRAQETPEGERDKLLRPAIDLLLIQKLYSDGVQGAGNWLASLPEGEAFDKASAYAWHNMSHQRLSQLSSQQAADVWCQIEDREWAGLSQFSRFYDLVASGNGGDDQPFFESLQNKGWDDERVIAQFEKWSGADLQKTEQWLLKKGRSTAVRPLAIQGLIRYLEKSDPGRVGMWQSVEEDR